MFRTAFVQSTFFFATSLCPIGVAVIHGAVHRQQSDKWVWGRCGNAVHSWRSTPDERYVERGLFLCDKGREMRR